MRIKILIFIYFITLTLSTFSQVQIGGEQEINYTTPKSYTIGGITVSGKNRFDPDAIIMISGLSVGETVDIPGEKISSAIRNLWKQNLFSDVKISLVRTEGSVAFLDIYLVEQPRLSKFKFNGVSKSEADEIRKDIRLYREKIVTQNLIQTTKNKVREFFVDKGYYRAQVEVKQIPDTLTLNHVILIIDVKKGKKVKINQIIIDGNHNFSDAAIKRFMKDTKEKTHFTPFVALDTLLLATTKNLLVLRGQKVLSDWSLYAQENMRLKIFKTSKFLKENLKKDKKNIIEKYNSKGFRDAKIEKDSVYYIDNANINIYLKINEGHKYYFRNIYFTGNTKYSDKTLRDILGIEKGDVFNQKLLDTRLYMNPNGRDISSLYMDDGYLFFQVTPIEVLVENDSIDMEIRIYEGKQATINRITVSGNTKTNDHVIIREIRTRPGDLFRRSDIIRTQRELAQLNYFDPEKLNVIPTPNPADATVDVEYQVAEKSSDQIELSGGWGGGRLVGTLGISFNNFSVKNIGKKKAWQPLPSGDGQRLSIRAQSNGVYYQSYNFSFTEPWLGGKKPNAFSLTAYHSVQTNGQTKYLRDSNNKIVKDDEGNKVENTLRQDVKITGVSVGLGKRLRIPDDYFSIYQEISYQNYDMNQWQYFLFTDGVSNNLYYSINLSRNSIDQPIYPRTGSKFSLSLQLTPPYSLFDKRFSKDNINNLTDQEKYRWIEYHKWKITSSWFVQIMGNLVLNTRVGYGFLGSYNKYLGSAPFERFNLGGSGLSTGGSFGYLLGREIIALRGYDDESVSPQSGAPFIGKYTAELRYPFSLNPSATIYGLAFIEAGNTWLNIRNFNPFNMKRSAGIGIRVFLPMFGMLGLDWGYRFDDTPEFRPQTKQHQIHFTIGTNIGNL